MRAWFKSIWESFSSFLFSAERLYRKSLDRDTKVIKKRSQRIALQFYALEDHEDLKEITEAILNSSDTKDSNKQIIVDTGRRFFVFKYPSDGFLIKGYISFVPNPVQNPLLIFLRGGNRILGLTNPGSIFSCVKNYTVLATTYRGGVSEGNDEFGLGDVNDVDNLLLHLPELEKKLGIVFNPSQIYLLGASRGGMEMFLALSRSTQLQRQVHKAASLSGLLDIRELMAFRKDMREMFIDDYGLIPSINEETWIKQRDPMEVVGTLRKDLPFLILQGTDDIRLNLQVGHNMVKKLRENGNPVTYLEVEGGDHCLRNKPNCMDLITDWFEDKQA